MPPFLAVAAFFLLFALAVPASPTPGHPGDSLLRSSSDSALRFRPGQHFKVALFADLHYGENAWTEWGPAQDVASDAVMSTVLDAETPDFVVYLGDVITANNIGIPNASLYWDMAISPTRKRGIPFATIFGNHDDAPFVWPSEWFSSSGIPQILCPPASMSIASGDLGCSFRGTPRIELVNLEIKKNGLSHSVAGPKVLWPSVSNYLLPILSSKSGDAVVLMYFLDSGGGSYPEVISTAQYRWFQDQSQALNPDGRIPELIFWHIPSTAYTKVGPNPKSAIAKPCVGSINYEPVAPQEAEYGIMDLLAKRPSVKAIFVGHNHGLDWCCPYSTLWLCFARHTGYGGYGSWPRGARIIQFSESPFTMTSWIRMENGTEHSEIVLA